MTSFLYAVCCRENNHSCRENYFIFFSFWLGSVSQYLVQEQRLCRKKMTISHSLNWNHQMSSFEHPPPQQRNCEWVPRIWMDNKVCRSGVLELDRCEVQLKLSRESALPLKVFWYCQRSAKMFCVHSDFLCNHLLWTKRHSTTNQTPAQLAPTTQCSIYICTERQNRFFQFSIQKWPKLHSCNLVHMYNSSPTIWRASEAFAPIYRN